MTPLTPKIKRILPRARANVHTVSVPRSRWQHPQCKNVVGAEKQYAAQQNGASTHVKQPALRADTKKSRSVVCKKLFGNPNKLPLTIPLIFSVAFIVPHVDQAATLALNYCCGFSQAEVVEVSSSSLCSHFQCCSCPRVIQEFSQGAFFKFHSVVIDLLHQSFLFHVILSHSLSSSFTSLLLEVSPLLSL